MIMKFTDEIELEPLIVSTACRHRKCSENAKIEAEPKLKYFSCLLLVFFLNHVLRAFEDYDE